MTRLPFDFTAEPCDAAYVALIDAAPEYCETALLVVREDADKRHALRAMAPHLRYEGRASFWPGTESRSDLIQDVLHYAVTPLFVDLLKVLASRLYAWDWGSDLPEDLCFLRPDGGHWLTSVAHERDAWMWLTPTEKRKLDAYAPALSALLTPGDPSAFGFL